jgi:hypothetical protein
VTKKETEQRGREVEGDSWRERERGADSEQYRSSDQEIKRKDTHSMRKILIGGTVELVGENLHHHGLLR